MMRRSGVHLGGDETRSTLHCRSGRIWRGADFSGI
jgi:hypothetical protein